MITHKIYPWLSFNIHIPTFIKHLTNVISDYSGIAICNEGYSIILDRDLTTQEEASVQSYLDSLTEAGEAQKIQQESQIKYVQGLVENSMAFGLQLIADFATENVLMGITQANKTKEVADYLSDVMRYLQAGSLYEVINEINSLNTVGHPTTLAPFITTERMNQFKQRVVDFLT